MREDKLCWFSQEEIFIKLVVKLFCGCLFPDDSSCRPVSIYQTPGTVDVHGIPGVLI
jgi:hypothetical protein